MQTQAAGGKGKRSPPIFTFGCSYFESHATLSLKVTQPALHFPLKHYRQCRIVAYKCSVICRRLGRSVSIVSPRQKSGLCDSLLHMLSYHIVQFVRFHSRTLQRLKKTKSNQSSAVFELRITKACQSACGLIA